MTYRIGILETGRPGEELNHFPNYAEMTAAWLAPIGAECQTYPVMDGIAMPTPEEADLWVITGSKCGVYEDHDWIPPLEQFVREAKASGKTKMLGICFGHQLIAQALGGRVEKSQKGWGIGLQHYQSLWPEALGHGPEILSLYAYHQDQVLEAPVASHIIAQSDFCPIAGLWYPGFAISFQAHPEFNFHYENELIRLRHASFDLEHDIAEAGLASMRDPCNRLQLRDSFVEFWEKL